MILLLLKFIVKNVLTSKSEAPTSYVPRKSPPKSGPGVLAFSIIGVRKVLSQYSVSQ